MHSHRYHAPEDARQRDARHQRAMTARRLDRATARTYRVALAGLPASVAVTAAQEIAR